MADVAAILGIVAGPDGRDGGVAPVGLGDPAGVDLHRLRVAVQADNGLDPPTDDTWATIEAAASALRAAGSSVREARHPDGGHELTLEVWRSYGDEMSAAQMYGVLRRWDAFRTAMLAFMGEHDLILCPVFPRPGAPARKLGGWRPA